MLVPPRSIPSTIIEVIPSTGLAARRGVLSARLRNKLNAGPGRTLVRPERRK